MRTNSSSFGSSIGFDDVVPSSSGTTISDCPEFRKTLKQYGKFFSTRLIQVKCPHKLNEVLLDFLPLHPVCQLILYYTHVKVIFFLWNRDLLGKQSTKKVYFMTFSVDEEDQQGSWTNDVKSLLYHQLGVLLRSSMVAARMTPLHRYYVKKQSADTFIILYKLCEGQSTIELGSDAKRMELGRFPTPIGAFKLELAYRTQMEVERALTPEVGESLNQVGEL
uniref:PH domain-containing protein n=1 Tax=Heterorhabditis bacteriophora TaxID=37862 RepID=A0A1I7XIP8_HETBA